MSDPPDRRGPDEATGTASICQHGAEADLAITLAGGGNRAFYQMGLLHAWGPSLLPRVAALATCSAGACVAAMWLSGREEAAGVIWRARTEGLVRNIDWRRMLQGQPAAPHGGVFREIMIALGEGGGLERIRAVPFPVLVMASAFPDVLPPGLAVLVGIGAYQFERRFRPTQIDPTLGRRIAFQPAVFDMRECQTPADLANLVLASSATPPFTPVGRYRGRALLDGGMVDNAPAFVGDAAAGVRKNLVLLTRPYPDATLGERESRLYIAPSMPPPLERWDYTKPHLLQDNIALGRADAERYWPAVEAFLAR